MTACTKKVNGEAGEGNTPSGTPAVAADGTSAGDNPEVKTIYGEISEVVGNSVTIKLMERNVPAGGGQGGQAMQRGEIPASGSITLPDGTTMEWDEDNPLDFSKIQRPDGADGGGTAPATDGGITPATDGTAPSTDGTAPATDGTAPATDGGSGRNMQRIGGGGMERKYTGEEIEFIIPVGVPIMTMTRSDSGMKETELEMSKIKAGYTITVTYKEDGKAIDKILVMQDRVIGGPDGGQGGPGGIPGNLPANAQVVDFGDGRVLVTIPE